MIEWKRGDLFASTCQVLVCPVNMVGRMGKGLARDFRQRFPGLDQFYRDACDGNQFANWGSMLWRGSRKWVLLTPTKNHWRNNSELRTIEHALNWAVWELKDSAVESVAFPALGCGLGGLDWQDVRPLMERYLGRLDILVEIYEPQEAGE